MVLVSSWGLQAAVRTLPPDLYRKMRRGEVLEKVWIDPSYDKRKGFSLGKVINKAEGRERELQDLKRYVEGKAGDLANKGSVYQLDLAIVELIQARERQWPVISSESGRVTIEGQIKNAEGKLLAAFRIAEEFGGIAGWGLAIDSALNDLDQELLL
jgi:hypothetical protein